MTTVLAATGLEFAYSGVPVLHGTDVTVHEGEVLALVGPNGAGKTTLLRVLSGLERPKAGEVRLDGDDITRLPPEARARRGIATVFGGNAVFGDMTVDANLRAAGDQLRNDAELLAARVANVFTIFPRLVERRSALAAQLSGGEQQMLALGKALLLEPRVLCVDELSLGLAPALVARLLDVLRDRRAAGGTTLLVEQSVNVALDVADRIAYFERGRVCAIDDASALRADPERLHRLYFGGAA
jgi:ABC-type branched-subunit amino acid transport system ATPase component